MKDTGDPMENTTKEKTYDLLGKGSFDTKNL